MKRIRPSSGPQLATFAACMALALTALAAKLWKEGVLAEQHPLNHSLSENSNVTILTNIPSWAWCLPRCKLQKIHSGPAAAETAASTVESQSQDGEELWVYEHFFYGKRNGFFLEMGGYDGVEYSNTLWLEQAFDWRGILIEPSLGSYQSLIRNRPLALSFNAAICAQTQIVHYTAENSPIDGIYEFMAENFRQTWHPTLQSAEGLPEVPCVPLMVLLHKFGIKTIDFWSLDVEGGELEVLKAFDFGAVRVNTMVVELDGHNEERDKEIMELMNKGEMVLVHRVQWRNGFFVNRKYMGELSAKPGVAPGELVGVK